MTSIQSHNCMTNKKNSAHILHWIQFSVLCWKSFLFVMSIKMYDINIPISLSRRFCKALLYNPTKASLQGTIQYSNNSAKASL